MKIERMKGCRLPSVYETQHNADAIKAIAARDGVHVTTWMRMQLDAFIAKPHVVQKEFERMNCARHPTRKIRSSPELEQRTSFVCSLKSDPMFVVQFKEMAYGNGVQPSELMRYIVRNAMGSEASVVGAKAQAKTSIRLHETEQNVGLMKAWGKQCKCNMSSLVGAVVADFIAHPVFDRDEFDAMQLRFYLLNSDRVLFGGTPRSMYLSQVAFANHPVAAMRQLAQDNHVQLHEIYSYVIRRALANSDYMKIVIKRYAGELGKRK